MIPIDHIVPLTDFKRDTTTIRERLKASGRPAVLTIDGRPELVLQDAEAYQRMVEKIESMEAVEGIRTGLEDVAAGRFHTLDEAKREFHRRRQGPK